MKRKFFSGKKFFLFLIPLVMMACGDDEEFTAEEDFSVQEITSARQQKDEQFRSADDSPIPVEQRKNFHGLKYYPPSEDFAVLASFEILPQPDTIRMLTSKSGDVRTMLRYGKFSFSIGGKNYSLVAYKSTQPGQENSLFVPFRDATNGKDTYYAGRYLDIEEDGGEEYLLDFNDAYNPYCAYNDNYSCPLVPKENVLPVAITAGEKNYSK